MLTCDVRHALGRLENDEAIMLTTILAQRIRSAEGRLLRAFYKVDPRVRLEMPLSRHTLKTTKQNVNTGM